LQCQFPTGLSDPDSKSTTKKGIVPLSALRSPKLTQSSLLSNQRHVDRTTVKHGLANEDPLGGHGHSKQEGTRVRDKTITDWACSQKPNTHQHPEIPAKENRRKGHQNLLVITVHNRRTKEKIKT